MKSKLKALDTIVLSGKTEFGKSFIEENGTHYKVIKLQTWDEHQLLLSPLMDNTEIQTIWINLLPQSRNFCIDDIIHSDDEMK